MESTFVDKSVDKSTNTPANTPAACRVSLTKAACIGAGVLTVLLLVYITILKMETQSNYMGDLAIVILIVLSPVIVAGAALLATWPVAVYNIASCDDASTADTAAAVGVPIAGFMTVV